MRGHYLGKSKCPSCGSNSLYAYLNPADAKWPESVSQVCGDQDSCGYREVHTGELSLKFAGDIWTKLDEVKPLDPEKMKEYRQKKRVISPQFPLAVSSFFEEGVVKKHRGISSQVLSIFNYGMCDNVFIRGRLVDAEVEQIFDKDLNLALQKTRATIDGKTERSMLVDWRVSNKEHFFGQYNVQGNNYYSTLVICEAAIDAMSVYEAYKLKGGFIPYCVSLPKGAHNLQVIDDQLDWLNKFEEIVVFLDADQAGQSAAIRIYDLLNSSKVRIAKITGYKDVNEALVAGKTTEIQFAVKNAKPPVSSILLNSEAVGALFDTAAAQSPVISTGVSSVDDLLGGGWEKGQLSILTGGSGCGKSTLLNTSVVEALRQGETVLYYNTEMPTTQLYLKLASAYYNQPFISQYRKLKALEDKRLYEEFMSTVAKDAALQLMNETSLHIVGREYTNTWEDLANNLPSLVTVKDVNLFVLDNMTGIGSHNTGRKELCDSVCALVNKLSVSRGDMASVILVHLTDKGGGQTNKDGSVSITYETGAETSASQLAESSSFKKFASSILGYERDSSSDSNFARVRLLKSREGQTVSQLAYVEYQPKTDSLKSAHSPVKFTPVLEVPEFNIEI
jgi:hypothetical protein